VHKALKFSGLLYVLATVFLALYYLPERVFYTDSAAQVFEIILNKGYAIYVNRYSMFLQQLLPVFAVNLALPLYVVASLYSLAVPIISLACFYLCLLKYKNAEAAIAILLSGTIVGHEFFHAISETTQLIPYVAVFYASMLAYVKQPSIGKFCLSFMFLFLAYFIHPISILLLGFVFLTISIQNWNRVRYLFPLLGALVVVFVTKTALTYMGIIGQHDSQFLNQLSISFSELKDVSQFPFIQGIKKVFFNLYSPSLVFLGMVLFAIIRRKKRWLALELAAAFGFIVICTIVFRLENTPMALSARYMPIAFFVAVSARSFFGLELKSKAPILLVSILPIIFIGNVIDAGNDYKKRSELIEKYIHLGRQAGFQKYYFQPTEEEYKGVDMSWGVSIESILRSSLYGGKTISIYPRTDLIHTDVLLGDKGTYNNVAWWPFRYDEDLNNSNYFNISGKTHPLINWKRVSKIQFSGKVKLESAPLYLSDDRRIVVLSEDKWVRAHESNLSELALDSGQTGLSFSVLLAPEYNYIFQANSENNLKLTAKCSHGLTYETIGRGRLRLLIPASESWSNYTISIQNIDSTSARVSDMFISKGNVNPIP
jgi:hypothetical protein